MRYFSLLLTSNWFALTISLCVLPDATAAINPQSVSYFTLARDIDDRLTTDDFGSFFLGNLSATPGAAPIEFEDSNSVPGATASLTGSTSFDFESGEIDLISLIGSLSATGPTATSFPRMANGGSFIYTLDFEVTDEPATLLIGSIVEAENLTPTTIGSFRESNSSSRQHILANQKNEIVFPVGRYSLNLALDRVTDTDPGVLDDTPGSLSYFIRAGFNVERLRWRPHEGSTQWSGIRNWSPIGPPEEADIAYFDEGGIVTFDGMEAVDEVFVGGSIQVNWQGASDRSNCVAARDLTIGESFDRAMLSIAGIAIEATQMISIGDADAAQGRLTVESFATVETPTLHVGGDFGSGHLRVELNGAVQTNQFTIGRQGLTELTGGSVTTTTTDLAVGAQLSIGTGGQLQSSGDFSNAGSVTVAPGGTVGSAAFNVHGGALLELQTGGIVQSQVLSSGHVKNDGTIVGSLTLIEGGLLSGNGQIQGNLITLGGTIAPGLSPGILTIDGNLEVLTGAAIEIEIGGNTAGTEHDQMRVSGDTFVEGLIRLKFIRGYSPEAGEIFDFLSFQGSADLSGATIEIENLLPGFEFDIVPTGNGVRMVALTNGTFVPEPTAAVTLLMGLVVISATRIQRVKTSCF